MTTLSPVLPVQEKDAGLWFRINRGRWEMLRRTHAVGRDGGVREGSSGWEAATVDTGPLTRTGWIGTSVVPFNDSQRCNRLSDHITKSAPARSASAPAWPPAVAAPSSTAAVARAASACPSPELTPPGVTHNCRSIMRFRAESHLRRPPEFARVRSKGRRYHCGGFVLWAAPREPGHPCAHTRAGFVASRAAVGPAVARNRAKRRLRELFRQHQDRIPADVDLVFVARRALVDLAPDELERRFLAACAHLFPVAAP